MSALKLTPLGDRNAVVCDGDVCVIPVPVIPAAADANTKIQEIGAVGQEMSGESSRPGPIS